jgi:hypothetical protein
MRMGDILIHNKNSVVVEQLNKYSAELSSNIGSFEENGRARATNCRDLLLGQNTCLAGNIWSGYIVCHMKVK